MCECVCGYVCVTVTGMAEMPILILERLRCHGHPSEERDHVESSDPEFRLEIEICKLLCYKSVTY